MRRNQKITPLKFVLFALALGVLGFAGNTFSQRMRNVNNPTGQLNVLDRFLAGNYIELIMNNDINRPISNDPTSVAFTVNQGESLDSIGERLAEGGLIRDKNLFRIFARVNELDRKVQAGNFTLRRNMSIAQIAQSLQRASTKEVTVTIPEGRRIEEVAELLEEQLSKDGQKFDGSEFLRAARRTTYDYPFLRDLPDGASLEGYLFPDTYRLPENPSPLDVLLKMLDNFGAKAGPLLDQARQQGRSPREVMTIASIVEREAVNPAEQPTIASVYLNRLKIGMPLQADPTTQYALGYDPESKKWWRTITQEDYKTVDPGGYNTYINPALPPGPIANPGLSSIQAAVNPSQTNFRFFLACQGDRSHQFSVTYEEHLSKFGSC